MYLISLNKLGDTFAYYLNENVKTNKKNEKLEKLRIFLIFFLIDLLVNSDFFSWSSESSLFKNMPYVVKPNFHHLD